MSAPPDSLRRQLPFIQQIIRDETWLEGERRGCPVSESDPKVVDRVCGIVLTVGEQLRRRATDVEGNRLAS
jgi:hypothetical protein